MKPKGKQQNKKLLRLRQIHRPLKNRLINSLQNRKLHGLRQKELQHNEKPLRLTLKH